MEKAENTVTTTFGLNSLTRSQLHCLDFEILLAQVPATGEEGTAILIPYSICEGKQKWWRHIRLEISHIKFIFATKNRVPPNEKETKNGNNICCFFSPKRNLL